MVTRTSDEEEDVQLPAADSSDDEGLEDAEEEFVGGEDSSDEEDDTADTAATYIGNAVAPTEVTRLWTSAHHSSQRRTSRASLARWSLLVGTRKRQAVGSSAQFTLVARSPRRP